VTQQQPDLVDYLGRVHAVTAVDGSDLFDPLRYGWTAPFLSTACWRGYLAKYAVVDGHLRLVEVEIGPKADPPDLFGTPPSPAGPQARYPNALVYTGLSAPVEFTGRMLVGRGYVSVGRLGVGYAPAWFFSTVHDLEFDDDRLVGATDVSDELAEVRDRLGTPREYLAGLREEERIHLPWSLSYAWSRPAP
jgi:hypothetical protein